MRPNDVPMSWEDFVREKGPFSIAIDGYVAEGPRLDPRIPAANFDHHKGVARLETRATCAQVHFEIQLGLFKLFRDEDGPRAKVYANDCDEDVCMTWLQLANPHLAGSIINPRLNQLVDLVDRLDSTAGMFPYPVDMPLLRELAWVFEPYRRFRLAGGLDTREAGAFTSIVTDVELRIMQFILGRNKTARMDVRYKRLNTGTGWTLIEEIGPYGRQGALSDGVRAFITAREHRGGGWAYIVGRLSEAIPFPVPQILSCCDNAEGNPLHHWGGGTTIGGSPRAIPSRLDPSRVYEIAEEETLKFIGGK